MTSYNRLPPLPVFVNRLDELQTTSRVVLAARSPQNPARVWFTGPQGVGKSALAVRVGYEFLSRFPDAQFYGDCGASAAGGPVDPGEILGAWLRQLGRDENRIPAGTAQRQSLFWQLTYPMKIVVVLDDVATGGQVEQLLPSSPSSVTVLTSRLRHDRLYALGFTEVEVEPLSEAASAELLAAALAPDVLSAEPDAVRDLITLCAGLPLALTVAAARINRYRRRPVSAFVDLLRGDGRLDALRLDGEWPVRQVLDACYLELAGPAREAYRLLGLHPGPTFGAAVVAAMLGTSADEARDVLDELVDLSCLRHVDGDRYRFHHSLIARHARDRAVLDGTETRNQAALDVMLRWYAGRAAALAKVFSGRWWVSPGFATVEPAFDGPDARVRAIAELRAEQDNLHAALVAAAGAGWHAECVQLAEALQPWYYNTDRDADLISVLELGVTAAAELADPARQMRMHHDLGAAYEKSGDFPAAIAQFRLAGRYAVEAGRVLGEQSALEWEGLSLAQTGDTAGGLGLLRRSWAVVDQRIADPVHRERAFALLRMHIGRLTTQDGRPAEALPDLTAAQRYFLGHRDREPTNVARTLHTRADALAALGQHRDAVPLLAEAMEIFAAERFLSRAQTVAERLADVHRTLAEPAAARAALTRAVVFAEEQGLVDEAERLRRRLD